jgi:hypothetical protein
MNCVFGDFDMRLPTLTASGFNGRWPHLEK